MNDPADLPHVRPAGCSELLREAIRTDFWVVGVVENDVAVRQEVGLPRVEVTPDAFVSVVAVEPQESHRLFPSGRQDLAGDIEEAHVLVGAGSHHVAKEGGSILGPELAAQYADERLVRLDGINSRAVAGGGAACKRNRRAASVAADLDDAAVSDLPSQVIEEHGGFAREPTLDGCDFAQLVRPGAVFLAQTLSSRSGQAHASLALLQAPPVDFPPFSSCRPGRARVGRAGERRRARFSRRGSGRRAEPRRW